MTARGFSAVRDSKELVVYYDQCMEVAHLVYYACFEIYKEPIRKCRKEYNKAKDECRSVWTQRCH